jgi:CRP-like cAMP-binding protein
VIVNELIVVNEMMNMPILQSLDQQFIEKLASGITSRHCGRDEIIARQGTPGTSLIFVLRGVIDISISGIKVATLTSGTYFGEANLIGLEKQWAATLSAQDRCEVCEFTHEHWEKTLTHFPAEKKHFDSIFTENRTCTVDGTLANTCQILAGLSESTLRAVDRNVANRIYFPGEMFIVEGKPGNECFMLVQGRASVMIAGRQVRKEECRSGINDDPKEDDDVVRARGPRKTIHRCSQEPVCFGELGFFGVSDIRTSSVVAQTVCQVRVLYRDVFLKTLEEYGETLHSTEMNQLLQERLSNDSSMSPSKQRLREINFFEVTCSDEFFDFIAHNLEDRIFLKGQTVVPQDNSLYIIVRGAVWVLMDEKCVSTQREGAVFGSIPALGLGQKEDISTFETSETCYIQVLHQSVIIRALEHFPEERQKVLMMAFRFEEYALEAEAEAAKGGVAFVAAMKGEGRDARRKTLKRLSHGRSRSRTLAKAPTETWKNTDSDDGSAYKSQTRKAFMRAMQKSPLFKDVSALFLDHLSAVSVDRIYMPGDLIIEEGKRGDSMFIMFLAPLVCLHMMTLIRVHTVSLLITFTL